MYRPVSAPSTSSHIDQYKDHHVNEEALKFSDRCFEFYFVFQNFPLSGQNQPIDERRTIKHALYVVDLIDFSFRILVIYIPIDIVINILLGCKD